MAFVDNLRNFFQGTPLTAINDRVESSKDLRNLQEIAPAATTKDSGNRDVSPLLNSNSPTQYRAKYQNDFSMAKEIPKLKNGWDYAMDDPSDIKLGNLWVTWRDKSGNFGEGVFLVDKNSMDDGKLNIFGYKEYNPEYGWEESSKEWLRQLDAPSAVSLFENIRKKGGKMKVKNNEVKDWDKSEVLWTKDWR